MSKLVLLRLLRIMLACLYSICFECLLPFAPPIGLRSIMIVDLLQGSQSKIVPRVQR